MRLTSAKKVAAEHGHKLEYDNSLRLYILCADGDDSVPKQWFPGQSLKNMSESTFKYFYLRVPLDEVLEANPV